MIKRITIFTILITLTILLIGCISQEMQETKKFPNLTLTNVSKEIIGNKISVVVKVSGTNNCSLNLSWVRFVPDNPKYITKPNIRVIDGLCDGDSLMVNYSIDNMDFVPDGVFVLVFNGDVEWGFRIKEVVI